LIFGHSLHFRSQLQKRQISVKPPCRSKLAPTPHQRTQPTLTSRNCYPTQSHTLKLNLLPPVRNDRRSLLLAQLNATPLIRSIQRRIEEVTQVVDDRADSAKVGERAVSCAAESSGEGAGFDELGGEGQL
jgi:hypothetical protein